MRLTSSLLAAGLALAAGAAPARAAAANPPGQHVVAPTPVGPDELLALVHVHGTWGECSGSLISADTVLTAAHCVCTINWVGGNVCPRDASVTFRPDPLNPGTTPPTLHGTATFHPDYNPSWLDQQIEGDYAVIKLDGVAPNYIKPFLVAPGFILRHSDALTVGFGLTGGDCNVDPQGQPNKQLAPVDDYEDGHNFMRFDDQVVCPGDSGGPVMSPDGLTVFGVNSANFWTLNDGWVSKAPTTGAQFSWIKSFMCPALGKNRCDGDGDVCHCTGSSQILWRGPDGRVSIWYVNGGTWTRETSPGTPGLDWQIQGNGDFNGDGQADILWRNANGQVAIWYLSNGYIAGQAYPGGTDPGHAWTIQAVGDLDGDGRADILWRDVSGQLAIWFEGDANHAAYPGYSNTPAPVDNSWAVLGLGDFDGDGHADILWKHSGGQAAIWYMNGGTRVGEAYPGTPNLLWKLQGIGDFDGNGKADILWRSNDNWAVLRIWFAGVAEYHTPTWQNGPVAPTDQSWQIQGVGDFNHDGRSDILWRNPLGWMTVWFMDGERFLGEAEVQARIPAVKVQGIMYDRNF